jgi:hypothetical protein
MLISIHRLWRGQVPLADAFWYWAVLGGLAVNLTSSLLFVWLITLDQPVAALAVGYGPSIPFNIVVCVGVWRAADNHPGDRRWAELARFGTLVGMILLSIS